MKKLMSGVDLERTRRRIKCFVVDVCCHFVLQRDFGHRLYNIVNSVCMGW